MRSILILVMLFHEDYALCEYCEQWGVYADCLNKRDSADWWDGVLLFCDMLITTIWNNCDDVKWWVIHFSFSGYCT